MRGQLAWPASVAGLVFMGFWLSPRVVHQESFEVRDSVISSSATAIRLTSLPKTREIAGEGWDQFRQSYGSKLLAEYSEAGLLSAVHGRLGEGIGSPPGFSTQNREAVRRRSEEILRAASQLLGLRSELPLGEPIIKTGSVTAHAYYKEQLGDLPVEPVGSITLDLGSNGELVGLYSSYAPDLSIASAQMISRAQAVAKAEELLREDGSAPEISGGRRVVWVGDRRAKVAYEFRAEGSRVLVDAATGELLGRSDERVH